jgi:hypothetical protein
MFSFVFDFFAMALPTAGIEIRLFYFTLANFSAAMVNHSVRTARADFLWRIE